MQLSFFLPKTHVIQNEFNINPQCRRVNKKNIFNLGNLSWNMGMLCALNFPHVTSREFIASHDIKIITKDIVPILNKILFSSFDASNNSIILYPNMIDKYFVPSAPSNFNHNHCIDLLLYHEIFHFLQCTNQCPLYKINCLNEIAAYSFTRKVYS